MSNYHTGLYIYDSQEHIVINHLYKMIYFIHYMYIEIFIQYMHSLDTYFSHYIICDKDINNI